MTLIENKININLTMQPFNLQHIQINLFSGQFYHKLINFINYNVRRQNGND